MLFVVDSTMGCFARILKIIFSCAPWWSYVVEWRYLFSKLFTSCLVPILFIFVLYRNLIMTWYFRRSGEVSCSYRSLKIRLCNVLFSDNISVLKVYSKSFVDNACNDFAGYSLHPSFIFSVKKDTRTLLNIPSMKTSQQKRLEK